MPNTANILATKCLKRGECQGNFLIGALPEAKSRLSGSLIGSDFQNNDATDLAICFACGLWPSNIYLSPCCPGGRDRIFDRHRTLTWMESLMPDIIELKDLSTK
jgi:hypothetical protein